MIFFMTGKYFTCNLLDLMTYILKHEHHEWFVMRILEKIKIYFKLENCGIQNVLKLFWIRLPHFLFVIFNSMFFMFDHLYHFFKNNIPRLWPFWSVCFEGLDNWAKSFMLSIENFIYIYNFINFKTIYLGKKTVVTLH